MSLPIQFPDDLSVDRSEIKIFRTPFTERDEGQIMRWAEIFRVNSEMTDDGRSIVFHDEENDLEIFHASDSVWWADVPTMNTMPTGPVDLPNEEEAVAIAENFLHEHEVFDPRVRVEGITYSTFGQIVSDEEEPEMFNVAMMVNYAYELDGLPLLGPGARMGVIIGAEGRVVQFFRFWREPQEGFVLPLVEPEAAARLLHKDPTFSQLNEHESRIDFHNFRLGYYALPCTEPQGILAPVYQFDGVANTPGNSELELSRNVVAVHTSFDEMKELGAVYQNPARIF